MSIKIVAVKGKRLRPVTDIELLAIAKVLNVPAAWLLKEESKQIG